MALSPSRDPLVWVDCEMTGLDPATDSILQISCLVTDHALNLLDKVGWGAIIHHPTSVLESMNEWCIGTHRSTGLTEAVLKSSTTADQAATELLGYIKRFVPQPRTAMLAGNSIHTDRAFLTKKPYDTVLEHLHYRIFDVSSIKEAARRWASPKVLQRAPKKKLAHEARQDVLESIEEARFYRKAFFA